MKFPCFGSILAPFLRPFPNVDFRMDLGRLLAPFWPLWLLFGSRLAPVWHPLAPFWHPLAPVWLPLALFWSPLAPYWLRFGSFLGPSGHAWALFSHFCTLLALMLSSYDQCSLNFLENQFFIYVPTYFTSRNRFHKAPPFRATFDAHAKDNSSKKLQGPRVQIWVGGIAKRKQLLV